MFDKTTWAVIFICLGVVLGFVASLNARKEIKLRKISDHTFLSYLICAISLILGCLLLIGKL
jgi:hypothetical protein